MVARRTPTSRGERHSWASAYGGQLMARRRVLFLCTHNSARSQMAEGLLRSMASDRFEVASAGTEKTRVQPLAVKAMAEAGIDLSSRASKTLDAFVEP